MNVIAEDVFIEINHWLEQEKKLGSIDPACVILSTSGSNRKPHSRIVAVREITPEGILFFAHRKSRKVLELNENPNSSMVFWFAIQQREIVLEGPVSALTTPENLHYWQTCPRERQIKLLVSYPLSGEIIEKNDLLALEQKYDLISEEYAGKEIPMHENYCGFRLKPYMIYFYTLGQEKEFSTVVRYRKLAQTWQKELISP